MADITNLFKATVKALKSRNAAINELIKEEKPKQVTANVKQDSDFEAKAKKLVKTISELRDFLLEHRKDYVNAGSLLSTKGATMTETERDQIDNDAQDIIKTCRQTIVVFRTESDQQRAHPQVKEHRTAVMILIESYLKAICKMYSEQRAVRVKRVVDRKRVSKLEPERRRSELTRSQLKKDLNIGLKQVEADKENQEPGKNSGEKNEKPKSSAFLSSFDEPYGEAEDDKITEEEAQMFELENKTLYEEMNSMAEEVKQIEGQVVEIAKLQEIFTEKILEQDVQINNITNTVVGTTENIKDANEEIREAIKKKAEFRVWILFFLVVCSLSLLFLDWYNY